MESVSSTFSDSSKTGSSSSKSWADDVIEQVLSEDSGASPVDLECFIQAERMTKLLDELVYKSKVALCLPLLIREQRTLAKFMTPQDLEEVSLIFDQYDNPLFSTSLVNMAAMDDIQCGEVSLKHRLNPELGHLLYTVNAYKDLQPKIELMIQKVKLVSTKSNTHKTDIPVGFEYLLQLEQFRDLMKAQMQKTAAQELKSTSDTRKLEASNRNLVEKIKMYRKDLAEERFDFEKVMEEKKLDIAKLELQTMELRHTSDATLRKKILDSERQMVVLSRAHLVRSEMFKEVEIDSRETYDKLLKKDMLEELTNRQRRRKVETQLMSWIQKYDLEMTEKQNELDELTKEVIEEAATVKRLEHDLEEQDKVYEPLIAEKDAEYQKELAEKMIKFRTEHAARVIQVAWRETLANRAEKKKLRKLLKQQQAAAAAVVRLAEAEAKKVALAAKKEEAAAKRVAKSAAKEAKTAPAKQPKETKEQDETED